MAPSTSFADHASQWAHSVQKDGDVKSKDVIYTTSDGVQVPHPYETQRAGENGPLLLQDL